MELVFQEHIIFEIIKFLNVTDIYNFLEFLEKKNNIIYKNIVSSIYAQIINNYKSLKLIKETYDNLKTIKNCTKYMEYKAQIYDISINFPPHFLNTYNKQLIYIYSKRIYNEKQRRKYHNLFEIILKNKVDYPITKIENLKTKYIDIDIILFNKIVNTVMTF